jgi:xylulokinase
VRRDYLLGVDLGTTSTKVILVDTTGHLLAEVSRPATLRSPQIAWAEEDPEEWWQNVGALVPECLHHAGINAGGIAAVGVSGMVPAVVLTDGDGFAVRPSIQQNDARAVAEIAEQRRLTDEQDILRRTGSAITQQSVGPKLLWLRRHEPETLRRAARVMGSYDYLARRLTAAWSIERNWALESGLFDLHREDWDDDLLRLATIDRAWVTPARRPDDIVGTVTAAAAAATGLAPGTPVAAGSADHVASAFAAGVTENGDLLVKLGGAGDILYCSATAATDPRLFLDYHLVPGKFLINGCMAASGSLVRWFRDRFAPGADYGSLDREAAALDAGADGLIVLPYFLGEKTPINDPLARGTIVGLTLSHTRGHVYRAILEGIAFGFRHHVHVMRELGHIAARVRVSDGGARSAVWRQITADILGLPLEHITRHPGSSLGAAFAAGMAVGVFEDWRDIDRFVTVAGTTEPNPHHTARYQEMFALYLDLYAGLKDTFPRLQRAVSSPGEREGS